MLAIALFAGLSAAQGRTNRLTRPCPATTTPAKVDVQKDGSIDLVPCPGKSVRVNGAELASVPNTHALQFTAANVSHVNHGLFWVPSVAYTTFYADALIKPTGGQYFLSAGYGGAHNLLWGVNGDANGFTLSGNVYSSDTSTSTPFQTTEKIRYNEWAHVAVMYDGARIASFINGVPSAATVYTGNRKTLNAYEGTILIGGSDHLMYTGRLGGLRIFEGVLPYDNLQNIAYRPPVENFNLASVVKGTATVVNASFLADYRTGKLEDYSAGLSGARHNGYRAATLADSGSITGQLFDSNVFYNRDPSRYPQWVVDPFSYSSTAATQKTQIATTRIYDDFSRADVHYGVAQTLGLGTTRVGAKAWTAANYGILNGNAFYDGNVFGASAIIADAGNTDGSIIWRRPSSTTASGLGVTYRFVFRYQDAANYHMLYVDEFGTGIVYQVVAGVLTALGANYAFGTAWTEAKVILTGATVDVYNGGASLGTRTMTQFLTATSKGFILTHPILRISEFGVI